MKISITRALAKTKTLRKRLDDLQYELYKASAVSVAGKIKGFQGTKEEFVKYYSSLKDSYKSLQKEYVIVKTAIAKANSTNVIENVKLHSIAADDITPADLMALKVVLKREEELLNDASNYYKGCLTTSDKEREDLKNRIFKNLESLYSGTKALKKGDENTVIEDISSKFEVEVVSLYSSKAELDKELENVREDLREIDFLLSEFNSKTEIEIEE